MGNPDNFNFKDLHVWQKAVQFAKTVIDTVEKNSSERKHFRLLEQVESSATSVALNIAEGKGRHSKKEFVQFLYIARGSLFETVTMLNIFHRKKWINKSDLETLEREGLQLAKMLNAIISSIKKSI